MWNSDINNYHKKSYPLNNSKEYFTFYPHIINDRFYAQISNRALTELPQSSTELRVLRN